MEKGTSEGLKRRCVGVRGGGVGEWGVVRDADGMKCSWRVSSRARLHRVVQTRLESWASILKARLNQCKT